MGNKHIQAAIAAFFFFFGAMSAVHADDHETPTSVFETAPLAFDGHLGLGTPRGLFGGSVTYTHEGVFALSAGGGAGFTGPQLSLMPRIQMPLGEQFAIGVGAGISMTPNYQSAFALFDEPEQADTAYWRNGEVYLLFQEKNTGLRWGIYGGATELFAATNPTQYGEPIEALRQNTEALPYFGLLVGGAL